MTVTKEDVDRMIRVDPLTAAMDMRNRLTVEAILDNLEEGIVAKTTKKLKIRGALNPQKLPKGYKIIATSGRLIYGKDGETPIAGDGETVIQWDEILWDERRANRVDAQKLRNMYPPERHEIEHKGRATLIIEGLDDDEPKPKPKSKSKRR